MDPVHGEEHAGAAVKVGIDHGRGQGCIGRPVRQGFAVQQQFVLRGAGAQVEITHPDGVGSVRPAWLGGEGARGGAIANHCLASRAGFPGRNGDRGVSVRLHGLGFDALRILADAAQLILDPGDVLEPCGDRIPPYDGVPRLVLKERQCFVITLVIDQAMQRPPARRIRTGHRGALVVRIVDVLHQGLAVVQHVVVGNVVHEEQQAVGAGFQGLVDLSQLGWVLANEASARGDRAIHADAFAVSPEPLPPAVALGRLDTGTVVDADDVGQAANAERTSVLLVHPPGVASAGRRR